MPPSTIMNGEHQLLRFFIDNATGLSVAMLSLYLMYRLLDKHLTKITFHLESLHQLVMILQIRNDRTGRDTENALQRIEKKIERGFLSPDWLASYSTQHKKGHDDKANLP